MGPSPFAKDGSEWSTRLRSKPGTRSNGFRAFAAHWQSKRGQRRALTRADIDSSELGPFLPHMYMLDVLPGPRVKVRLLGTEAMQSGGVDYTGRFADEVLPPDRYVELQQEVDDVLRHFVLRYKISDLA
jgi:hypothetical protein